MTRQQLLNNSTSKELSDWRAFYAAEQAERELANAERGGGGEKFEMMNGRPNV
jgi:hypothetical protein